ncbi:hypothetical protein G9A89_006170 [Geosiphon pyriformis]|nr:hypothetical protein G9A89_006170 [Geosiphon pyriformis]
MHVCHNCDSKSLPKSRPISNHLPANDAAINLSTASILTSNLSTAATSNLSATTLNNLSVPTTNTNTTPKPYSNNIRQAPIQIHSKLEIGNSCSPTNPQFIKFTIRITLIEFGNLKTNPIQKLTSNILPATVTKDEILAAIFPFEFEKTTPVLLFSGAALEKKPITAMYTDAKVDGHFIKLILDSGSADSIIT